MTVIKKKYRKRTVWSAVPLMLCVAFLVSCGGGHSRSTASDGKAREMRRAENLTITDREGYTEVTVRNPWDTVRTLQKYLLVDRDSVLPDNLPQGTVIRTPVRNALVYSTVHNGLIKELGAIDAIGGVCNSEYIYDPELKGRISSGRIVDCGISMSPDLERIIKLHPEVIMLSPFENNDKYAKVGDLGIPILECADYMETSPLGRAEWVKFYGMLFGEEERGERMYASTEAAYLKLKEKAATAKNRPKVIIDQRYGQVWNVPGGNSTMGILIEDAGGENPFSHFSQSGSVAISPEKVLGEAHDADIWFVRYNQKEEKSMAELAADAPVNSRFKAYREGNVYGCNTRYINFYEETPFHPDRLLRDMVILMHPGLMEGEEPEYYHKLQ